MIPVPRFYKRRWLEEYLLHRSATPLVLDVLSWGEMEKSEVFAPILDPYYQMLQHSGLLYGLPVVYPFTDKQFREVPDFKKAKYVLLDMLLFTAVEEISSHGSSTAEYATKVRLAITWVEQYYRGMAAVDDKNKSDSLGELIFGRVSFRRNWFDFSKKGINSHLFWDWFFFRRYVQDMLAGTNYDKTWFRALVEEKKAMKLLTHRIIIAAFYSDGQIAKQERLLLHYFLKSARLFPRATRQRVYGWMKTGLSLYQIHIPPVEPIVRQYLLDVALLALLADQEYGTSEQAFARELAHKLDLSEEAYYAAQVDMSCFLVNHGVKLNFADLRRGSWLLLMSAFEDNMYRMGHAAKEEYRETKDMAVVFGQLLKQKLGKQDPDALPSEEEIVQALDQLKDLPKFLPFFTLFFVPVPGITEFYIFLAYGLERLSGNRLRLLPSNFSRMVKKTPPRQINNPKSNS
jgi:hypothetical protein